MPDFFNSGKPDNLNVPLWKLELKMKGGDTIRFIPLHGVSECFGVNVHGKQVKFNDKFVDVACGAKNTHLFPSVPCPFDSHPDDDIKKVKTKQFMLVYIVSAPDQTLNGRVGFIHLKYGVKASGAFDVLKNWEKVQTAEQGKAVTVEGQKISITREGNAFNNTTYSATVVGPSEVPLSPEKIKEQVDPIVKYLKDLYGGVTTESLNELYTKAIVGDKAPTQKDQPQALVDDSIEF